jgi:L-lysine 6-transaminase
LAAEFPAVVSNPRGLGLFAAFDAPAPEVRTAIRQHCMEKGLVVLPSGERAIRFRPPLTVTKSEIDAGMKIIASAIAKTT